MKRILLLALLVIFAGIIGGYFSSGIHGDQQAVVIGPGPDLAPYYPIQ